MSHVDFLIGFVFFSPSVMSLFAVNTVKILENVFCCLADCHRPIFFCKFRRKSSGFELTAGLNEFPSIIQQL
jgi:hypothetical protein